MLKMNASEGKEGTLLSSRAAALLASKTLGELGTGSASGDNGKPVFLKQGTPDAGLIALQRDSLNSAVTLAAQNALSADVDGSAEELCSWIANDLVARGFSKATKYNVVVFSSVQRALDIAARVLVNSGDAVAVESPSNPVILATLAANDAKLVPLELVYPNASVPEEEMAQMIGLQLRRQAPKAVFVRANFVVPTGRSLAAPTRRALRLACSQAGIPLVEEDADHHLGYDAPADPPVSSFAMEGSGADLAVYVSTVFGLLAPGLCLGYIYSPSEDIIVAIKAMKNAVDSGSESATVSETIVARYLNTPNSKSELQQIVAGFKERRDALVDTLEAELAQLRDSGAGRIFWPKPAGGTSLLLSLPYGTSGSAFLKECAGRVVFDLGEECYPKFEERAKPGGNTVRIGFGSESVDRVREGARILACVLKEVLARRKTT